MARGHHIAVTPVPSHVEVRIGGRTLASSDRALVLEETGLPPRYYLPPEDVRTELLTPTSRATTCPFKGQASYWSAVLGDDVHDNVAWCYETPKPEVAEIAGRLCFYNERVELAVGA